MRQRIRDGWLHLRAFDRHDFVGIFVDKPPLHLYHLFVRSDVGRTGMGTRLLAVADDRVVQSFGSPLVTVNSSLNAMLA
ncbi:MAG: GNAT family N-acetyltransferase [Rubripirellula sp.]